MNVQFVVNFMCINSLPCFRSVQVKVLHQFDFLIFQKESRKVSPSQQTFKELSRRYQLESLQ